MSTQRRPRGLKTQRLRFNPDVQENENAKRRSRLIEQGWNVKYGVIAVHKDGEDIRYFLQQRRFSVSYQELVMGNFNPHDTGFLLTLLERTCAEERRRIVCWSFKKIYCHLWGTFNNGYQKKYNRIKSKWDILRKGFVVVTPDCKKRISWRTLCAEVALTAPKKNTYEFPKGKRECTPTGKLESEWDCAMREFNQETEYAIGNCRVVPFVKPLVESFVGMNSVPYTHTYYLVKCQTMRTYTKQSSEARRIQWLTLSEALSKIWTHETSKRQMLINLHEYLMTSKVLDNVPHSPLPPHVQDCISRIVLKKSD